MSSEKAKVTAHGKYLLRELFKMAVNFEQNQRWENAYFSLKSAQETMLRCLFAEGGKATQGPFGSDSLEFWDRLVQDTEKSGAVTQEDYTTVVGYLENSPQDVNQLPNQLAVFKTESYYYQIVFYPEVEVRENKDPMPEMLRIATKLPGKKTFSLIIEVAEALALGIKFLPTPAHYTWLMAHLANAGSAMTLDLYKLGDNPVTFEENLKCYLKPYQNQYHQALFSNPNYVWAFAHYADLFRNIANGWFSPRDTLDPSQRRINYYKISISVFKLSRHLDPSYTWGNAHFGACVVNARFFLLGDNPDNNWLPLHEEAKDALRTALDDTASFYPWAMAYLAGVYLLEFFSGENKGSRGLAETIAFIAEANRQSPYLMKNAIDPGLLVTNSNLAMAQLYTIDGDYLTAWNYALKGLHTLNGSVYISRLAEVFVYSFLTQIRFANMDLTSTRPSGENVPNSPLPLLEVPKYENINTHEKLDRFISDVFNFVIKPCSKPHLSTPEDSTLPVKARRGLTILISIIEDLSTKVTTDQDLKNSLTSFSRNIQERLKIEVKYPSIQTESDFQHEFFSIVQTANMSSRLLKNIAGIAS